MEILCPSDKSVLKEYKDSLRCEICSGEYKVIDGIIQMLKNTNEFYEGAYKNTINYLPKKEWGFYLFPLWVVSNGYIWITRKYVPHASVVLELGCASGVKYFGKRYRMIGIDLSFSSLARIGDIYETKIQTDSSGFIPLPDNSVDAVISSYFWEHILESDKNKILQECKRILKPFGKMIFLFDVKTDNPLIKSIKKNNPEFYTKSFIEKDGHLGYHSPKENENILLKNGFTIVEKFGMEKTFFQSPSVYEKLGLLHTISGNIFRTLNRITTKLLKPYLVFLRVTDTIFKNILPDKWSRIFLIAVEKQR